MTANLRNACRVFYKLHAKLRRSPSMAEFGKALGISRQGAHGYARRLVEAGRLLERPQAHGSRFVPRRGRR